MGLSGSGKSYWTNNVADDEGMVILSSDALRKEFYGDENIQDNPAFIFEQMRIRTLQALKEGKSVTYDATNLSSKRRKALLKQLPKDVYKICHCIITPLEKCIENDSKRERHVSERVIMRQLEQFEVPWFDEGWDTIFVIKPFGDATLKVNLDVMHDCPKYHKNDTINNHIARVIQAVALKPNVEKDDRDVLLEVARFHDIGKPYTKTFYNKKGELGENAHYYNHENVGAYLYMVSHVEGAAYGDRENMYNDLFLAWLINNHMIIWNNQKKI
jgi:predicted kinase